jgi:hypothetical protein
MNTKLLSPELEQDYFSYNSKFCLSLGFFLSVLVVDDIAQVVSQGGIFAGLFYCFAALGGIAVLYHLAIGIRFTKVSLSKTAWTGTYNDEFLNTVNLIAYKVAFFAVILVAFVGMASDDIFQGIMVQTLCTGLVAISLTAYGLTAIVQLRDNDE